MGGEESLPLPPLLLPLPLQEERRDSWRYELGVSMIEIYNESIGDMLGAGRGGAHEAKLVVREGPTGNYIPDLVIKPVENVAQVGRRRRHAPPALPHDLLPPFPRHPSLPSPPPVAGHHHHAAGLPQPHDLCD